MVVVVVAGDGDRSYRHPAVEANKQGRKGKERKVVDRHMIAAALKDDAHFHCRVPNQGVWSGRADRRPESASTSRCQMPGGVTEGRTDYGPDSRLSLEATAHVPC